MDALARAGIPPADVIKIGTINGARALRIDADHGSIDEGKVADLFIIKGDPLKNIRNTRNIRYVVRAGKLYVANELLEKVKGKLGPSGAVESDAW